MQHPWWNSSVTFPHSCTIRYIPESAHHAELNCTHGGIFSEVSWNGVQMHCQQTISTCWWRAKVHLGWIKEVFVFCKCENHIKSEHHCVVETDVSTAHSDLNREKCKGCCQNVVPFFVMRFWAGEILDYIHIKKVKKVFKYTTHKCDEFSLDSGI